MSKKKLLDASALIALLNKENGYEQVAEVIPYAIMSSVNVSEAASILHRHGINRETAETLIHDLIGNIVAFNSEQAFIAAELTQHTKPLGLSLGDRACLSAAIYHKLPVVTADKVWGKLKLAIPIEIIR